MTPRLPRLKAQDVVRILRSQGFAMVASRGSHQKWRHSMSGKQVIVPFHQGRDLPLGTLRSIIEGSGIPLEEWR